jgi:hypothetical protein
LPVDFGAARSAANDPSDYFTIAPVAPTLRHGAANRLILQLAARPNTCGDVRPETNLTSGSIWPLLTWAELEAVAPAIAPLGRELLERFQFVLVGTLTKAGSPRVNPCEAYVIDGHLVLNMMPLSLKALDLLRDPRVYVHTPVTSKEGTEGEFKLAGRALVLEDEALRGKLNDLFWEMIRWRPAPDSHYFEVLAERVAYHRYGDQEISLRWSVAR